MAINQSQVHSGYQALVNARAPDEDYTQWYDSIGSYVNGGKSAALYLACTGGNVRLVTYIANKDKRIVNEYYGDEPMLLHALKPGQGKTWEQVRACVQSLINAGANVNARCKGERSNLLGKMIEEITELRQNLEEESNEEEEEELDLTTRMAAFLVANDAKCNIGAVGDLESKAASNPEDVADYLKSYEQVRDLAVSDKAQELWSKIQLVYVANQDQNSPFSALPKELLHETAKEIASSALKKS